MPETNPIAVYVDEVQNQLLGGHAREHGYRPALERLMRSFENVHATNDPKRSEFGNPDFVFLKKSNTNIILGYAEAKDINVSLKKTVNTEQLRRYAGYEKLFLTNYLDFRFFRNGEEYEAISIGKLEDNRVVFDASAFPRLMHELQAFLELPPEKIRSGKRLALIMGGKARRIRDNVSIYLSQEVNERNQELDKIFKMMKTLLVHDLTPEKFADMYAQTLVYGLFVARYNDKTPDDFSRSEARDLVPASNPFLREFFDHIVGPRFDIRLAHIVDELCEVFTVSDVHTLIQKHLRLFEVEDEKDPIIHFYEDFLKEYDPAERKKMGAYYTPIPVVRFIIRQVNEILKKEFGLSKGLADTSKIIKEFNVGQKVNVRNQQTGKMERTDVIKKEFHRVQVLDPAVGTATFLNETIKYIHKSFEGQEGRWPAYVEQDLLPRLQGFELMMAPYTIAHLKLGMTLQETGVTDLNQRLGVYLTNTLEEGVKSQQDLFSFGLAEIVSHEAEEAAKIKHEKPIMVIIGNPPYSVSSNNKSDYIENLIKDYKRDLNERNIQPLSDDYIKFIRFAEEMIAKNGEGIVAMITNNSYLDGLIHRHMRKHLLETFDTIYVLDLHGNSKKKETAPGGGKDVNVFDIQQGVSIIIAVKTSDNQTKTPADIYHVELFGLRTDKFSALLKEQQWQTLTPSMPNYFFVPKNGKLANKYESFVSIRELMPFGDAGIKTHRDAFVIDFDRNALARRIHDFYDLSEGEIKTKYGVRDTRDFSMTESKARSEFNEECLKLISYRPFDTRWAYYSEWLMDWTRKKTMKHFDHENLALITSRKNRQLSLGYIFLTDKITDIHELDSAADSLSVLPLYVYHYDSTRTANFEPSVLKRFVKNLVKSYEPEDTLDYIYAILHSPKYRKDYKEFLKNDFPRIPAPSNDTDFTHLRDLGKQLRELHLMISPTVNDFVTTYSESGSDEVDKVIYESGKVWINESQHFGNVPEIAWNFYIGGYQSAQKWLKDRKGRKLTSNDIEHYQKIIKILVETDRIMKLIEVIDG